MIVVSSGQLLSKGGFPLMVGTLALVRELPAIRFVSDVCRECQAVVSTCSVMIVHGRARSPVPRLQI
jgi:hypothetical protein